MRGLCQLDVVREVDKVARMPCHAAAPVFLTVAYSRFVCRVRFATAVLCCHGCNGGHVRCGMVGCTVGGIGQAFAPAYLTGNSEFNFAQRLINLHRAHPKSVNPRCNGHNSL